MFEILYFIVLKIYNHFSFIYLRIFKFDTDSPVVMHTERKGWLESGEKYYLYLPINPVYNDAGWISNAAPGNVTRPQQ